MAPPLPPRPMGVLFYGHAHPSLIIEVFIGSCVLVITDSFPSPRPTGFTGLQVFIDFCCPFSKKLFLVLVEEVMPAFSGGVVDLLVQCVPQPWHPQGSYLHEAALAVKNVDESKFFPASLALFKRQEQFFGISQWPN